jgi:hypothetical protein
MLILRILNHLFPLGFTTDLIFKNQREDFPAGWEKGVVHPEFLLKRE